MMEPVRQIDWPVDPNDDEANVTREWLVTNGLGGYASGTVGGVITRRYHGLLIAALSAPLGRIALLVAVVMVALVVVALQIDAPTRYLAATVLAYAAIALSVVAVVLGLVAVVRGRQRGVAIAALVIAVLGDPLVLLYGLGALT